MAISFFMRITALFGRYRPLKEKHANLALETHSGRRDFARRSNYTFDYHAKGPIAERTSLPTWFAAGCRNFKRGWHPRHQPQRVFGAVGAIPLLPALLVQPILGTDKPRQILRASWFDI